MKILSKSNTKKIRRFFLLMIYLVEFHRSLLYNLHVSKIYQYLNQIHHMLFKKKMIWSVLIIREVSRCIILILFKVFYLDVDTNSEYYEKIINQEINSSVLSRSIKIDNSVSLPVGTAIDLTIYQVKYYWYHSFKINNMLIGSSERNFTSNYPSVQVFLIVIQIVWVNMGKSTSY